MAFASFPRTMAGKAAARAVVRYLKSNQIEHTHEQTRWNGQLREVVRTKDRDLQLDIPLAIFVAAGVRPDGVDIKTRQLTIGGNSIGAEGEQEQLQAIRKRGQLKVMIHGQFSIEEAAAINQMAEEKGMSRVEVIRLAVREKFGL